MQNINKVLRSWIAFSAILFSSPVLAGVEFNGLDDEQRQNAVAYLALDDEPCDAPSLWIERRYRNAETEIRNSLAALGYYAPVIDGQLATGGDCWQATFSISTGDPVVVRELALTIDGEAADDPAFRQAIEKASLKEGRQFRHDHYESLKNTLGALASRRGYADAKLVENAVTVDPEKNAASITLRFSSGLRYAFGDVSFEQSMLNSELLEGFVPFDTGEPYDSRQIAEFYSVLAGSGYFEEIEVRPQLGDRLDGQIPVTVTLTPGQRSLYSIGVGFSTNAGSRARLGYTNRRANRRGHQWGFNGLLSDVVSEASVNYRLPYGDPRSEWLSFDVGFKHEATDTSESDTWQIGVRRVKQRANRWQETRFIDFLREDFVIAGQSDDVLLAIPGVSWAKSTSDNRLRPGRGYRAYLEISGSADALGLDTNFLQFDGRVKWIRSLRPVTRLIFRAEGGVTVASDFNELPPSVRFYAGGDQSVRGYGYETLGPKDANGDVIGGEAKLIGSVEIEQDILPKWSVAAFVDSGNAFNDFTVNPQTGAGLGARWRSPLGPIRLDVAKPFNGTDRSLRIHLTFGPDL